MINSVLNNKELFVNFFMHSKMCVPTMWSVVCSTMWSVQYTVKCSVQWFRSDKSAQRQTVKKFDKKRAEMDKLDCTVDTELDYTINTELECIVNTKLTVQKYGKKREDSIN